MSSRPILEVGIKPEGPEKNANFLFSRTQIWYLNPERDSSTQWAEIHIY